MKGEQCSHWLLGCSVKAVYERRAMLSLVVRVQCQGRVHKASNAIFGFYGAASR